MDHSELPQAARDRIEAAVFEAQRILEGFLADRDSLTRQAREMGTSLSSIDFAPGNIALKLAGEKEAEGREEAAQYLFFAASWEWGKWLKPDVEAFIAKLDEILQWAYQKFQLNSKIDGFAQNFLLGGFEHAVPGGATPSWAG